MRLKMPIKNRYTATHLFFGFLNEPKLISKTELTYMELPPVRLIWWNETSMGFHELKEYFKANDEKWAD